MSGGWRRRAWWITGAVLGVATAVAYALASDSGLTAVITLLLGFWLLTVLLGGVRWLWRHLTYRVGVRLLVSYLLAGVAPFVVLFALALTALYMVMGQYTSVRWGHLQENIQLELEAVARGGVHTARVHGSDAARADLVGAVQHPPEPLPRLLWMANFGGAEEHGEGAQDLTLPMWVKGDGWTGVVAQDDRFFEMAVRREDGDLVAVLLPLDQETARDLNRREWFDVYFVPAAGSEGESGGFSLQAGDEEGAPRIHTGGRRVSVEEIFQPGTETADAGLLGRRTVYWVRVTDVVTDLASGEVRRESGLVTVLRTSPLKVWEDFVLSRYELGGILRAVLLSLAGVFLVVWLAAALAAGTITFAIARSTARLSRGAREVAGGNLAYRIPVKRHDQLGDLAVAFNTMTESVQGMLAAVQEKERMARELELARAIQESLLPAREMRHGVLEVHATFRPAAAVGGDYFDLFPEDEGRLLVAIGDVAGHGLSTGLLMATVKSYMAAMVHEGYRGVELLQRVNRLLTTQAEHSTMVTLAVAELDVVRGCLSLANAGHPPPLVVTPVGEVFEVLVPSIPVGSRLASPAEVVVPLEPGSKVVLYSDGLVEAPGEDDDPFGYEALAAAVQARAHQQGQALVAGLLADLDRYVGGRSLPDDLTVLVIEVAGTESVQEGDEPMTGLRPDAEVQTS